MIDEMKSSLRVTTSDTGITQEIQGLIDGARLDLIQSGISSTKANDDTDALIKRAITFYCKAHFGYDNPESERFAQSYNMLKQHLSLASDYNGGSDAT